MNQKRDLICADCLDVFKGEAIAGASIDTASVDLIYLDPPFNSQQKYNLPFKKLGKESAPVEAFKDIWRWDAATHDLYNTLTDKSTLALKEFIDTVIAIRGGRDSHSAYLVNMATRLHAMKRVLKSTGSIYLHCDPTASHYLKIVMDNIYGKDNFRNEIIWCYRGMPAKARKWQSKHDVILFYSNSDTYKFNTQYGEPTEGSKKTFESAKNRGYNVNFARNMVTIFDEDKYRLAVKQGVLPSGLRETEFDGGNPPMRDWWSDIKILGGPKNKERLGYPTQKPRSLLARIIRASTDKGDIVLDPFCGCGTTAYAAEDLERQWIGIDISNFAVGVIKNSLVSSFSAIDLRKKIKESGIPTTPKAAKELAEKDRHEFEKWACGQIGARGLYKNPGAKGADGGIDGVIEFYAKKDTKSYAVVQVKSGTVKPNDVKALYADVSSEKKAMAGVFVCFDEYKRTFMNNKSHKKFKDEIAGNEWPVIQLVTIEELLEGKQPALPNLVRQKGSRITTQTELDM